MINKNKENKENNKLTQALNDFELARKSIEQTLENLKKAQNNLKITWANFSKYQTSKKTDYLNGLSTLGNPTFDEKAKLLENQFISCVFEDESNEKMIIFDEDKIDEF